MKRKSSWLHEPIIPSEPIVPSSCTFACLLLQSLIQIKQNVLPNGFEMKYPMEVIVLKLSTIITLAMMHIRFVTKHS